MSSFDSSGSALSSLAMMIVNLLQSADRNQLMEVDLYEGISNKSKEEQVSAINELLTKNRLILLQYPSGGLVYKLQSSDYAEKLEGLTTEQKLVYQTCEKAGNKVRKHRIEDDNHLFMWKTISRAVFFTTIYANTIILPNLAIVITLYSQGIWTRDIKNQTNIPPHTLTKTLKILEQRSLVKAVRSVASKSKKLYMLFDMTPSKEITGGPWYTEQEFDHQFVEELCHFIVEYIRKKEMASSEEIHQTVSSNGISRVELSSDETNLVIQTLMYDGRLEVVSPSVVQVVGRDTSKIHYKVCKEVMAPNYLTSAPCGVCPVSAQCTEGGEISPATCEYMKNWLNMQAVDGEQDLEW